MTKTTATFKSAFGNHRIKVSGQMVRFENHTLVADEGLAAAIRKHPEFGTNIQEINQPAVEAAVAANGGADLKIAGDGEAKQEQDEGDAKSDGKKGGGKKGK